MWATNALSQHTIVKATEIIPQQLHETVPLSGTVYAKQVSDLSAQLEGWITEVLVDTGDYVKKGDVLIKLDDTQIKLALQRAQAHLDEASVWKKLKQQEKEDADILMQRNNISANEARTRNTNFETAMAQWKMAKVSLEQAQTELKRHIIRAPFSGTVSNRYHSVGEWIKPGIALVEIVDTGNLKLDFQVPQRFFSQVEANASLELSLDDHLNQTMSARVSAKIPKATQGSRTFLLRSELLNNDATLFPGMALSGKLILPRPNVIAVPRDALIRYPDGRVTVWVAEFSGWEKNTKVFEYKVSLGISSGDWVEITNGIKSNAVVVTISNENLREGQDIFLNRDDRIRAVR
jgi:membrane fusion protein, multidrug efflux system